MSARAERVRAVRAAGTVNGIEWVEVASVDQRTLALTFVHPLPGQAGALPAGLAPLTAENLRVSGGVRVAAIRAVSAAAAGRVLTVTVDRAGDYSRYELSLVAAPGAEGPPAGFDPALARIAVDFKVACPSDLDCLAPAPGEAPPPAGPPIDYLAKDYASFRRVMLDRMSVTAPAWRERSPADAMVTLVEALAYVADEASYLQDAVATEAYLGTARLRPSLRRHARLLDYRPREGLNARAWVAFGVAPGSAADGATLPRGTALAAAAAGADPALAPDDAAEALPRAAAVFETMQPATLAAARSEIRFHDWSGSATVLRRGARAADLRRRAGLSLAAGDVLVLEERASPETGLVADADRTRRAAVRLTRASPGVDPLDGAPILSVEWAEGDALAFDLVLRARVLAGGVPTDVETAHALGNVVLADHGRTVAGAPGLVPAAPVQGLAYRPRLDGGPVVVAAPFDAVAAGRPAAEALRQDARAALPAITLADGAGGNWLPAPDLLGADRFAREFVVESDPARGTRLRFGGDDRGKAPGPGQSFAAVFRVGGGPAGNIGLDSLNRAVTGLGGLEWVRNPLPASGGEAAETPEEIRRYAPQAFRTQARAVTTADWAAAAEAHPEVSRARAELRWTGSWHTAFITVDRRGGLPVRGDAAFAGRLLGHLDALRVCGYDLELRDPVFVALDIELRVCLAPGYAAPEVRARLIEVFGSGETQGGGRGVFHPDNFTFGEPLHLSTLYAAAFAVDGVASVQPLRFRPRGRAPAGEIAAGVIRPGEAAILRCDSDPNRPENGSIDFQAVET